MKHEYSDAFIHTVCEKLNDNKIFPIFAEWLEDYYLGYNDKVDEDDGLEYCDAFMDSYAGEGTAYDVLEELFYDDVNNIQSDLIKDNIDWDGISLDLQTCGDMIVLDGRIHQNKITEGYYFWTNF